jgi:MFS family permease
MVVQAGALTLLVAGSGSFAPAIAAASLLGLGTALVYPTLLAAVSDASGHARAREIGIYRFWRDSGFVVGALLAGTAADAASPATAILIVAALTALSGLVVAATPFQSPPTERSRNARNRLSVRTPA